MQSLNYLLKREETVLNELKIIQNKIYETKAKKIFVQNIKNLKNNLEFKKKITKIRRAISDAKRRGNVVVTVTDQLYIETKRKKLYIRTKNECTPLQAVLLYNKQPPVMCGTYFDAETTIAKVLGVSINWVKAFECGVQNLKLRSCDDMIQAQCCFDLGQKIRKLVLKK